MKRVMTECPHCHGALEVTVDGNKLRMTAKPSPVTAEELLASSEFMRRQDSVWARADALFDRVFGPAGPFGPRRRRG